MENREIVKITLEQVKQHRNDHRFLKIIKLSRFVNHIRFCQRAMIANYERDDEVARRDLNAAILLSAGAFYELLKTLATMKTNFDGIEATPDQIGSFLDEIETKEIQGALKTIRDKVAFHLDKDAVSFALDTLQEDSYVYFVQESPQGGDSCFVFADHVSVVGTMFQVEETSDPELTRGDLKKRYFDLLTKTIRVQGKALALCTELIVRYSESIGVSKTGLL